jgi:AcrR family transcriptional regulator
MGTISASQPTVRRRMAAADRREQILAAALEVFAAGGYHETTLDAVAGRAAVSKALIYEHFSSKRELHTALLTRYERDLLERVTAATAAAEPGEPRLRAGVDAFLAFVEEHREAWRMLFRTIEDPEIADLLGRLQEELAAAIAALMAADARLGMTGDAEVELEVEMIARLLAGAAPSMANWWDEHREVPRERLLQSFMDFAWVGLERLGEGERWSG